MRLSEKGHKRICDRADELYNKENVFMQYDNFDGDKYAGEKARWRTFHEAMREVDLEPDDFEGGCFQNGNDHMVQLTVEEAKEIAFKLKELSEGYFLETGNIDSRSIEWLIVLDERIEQAEAQK